MTSAGKIAARLLVAAIATSAPAHAQTPQPSSAWLLPELLAAAKSESGALVVYASMNEEEALPYWAVFENATGVKVDYVRLSDSAIQARVAIEHRARQRSWDLAVTTTVYRMRNEILAPFDPPQAQEIITQARDPNRRWYGVTGNYNAPAYNTNLVKPTELPTSYAEFAERKQWAGKVAIDATDTEWLSCMLAHYGEARGKMQQAFNEIFRPR